jgi:hypothetical protein
VNFGPWADFAGCGWAGPAEWEADYAASLRPHEPTFHAVVAEAVGAIRAGAGGRAA